MQRDEQMENIEKAVSREPSERSLLADADVEVSLLKLLPSSLMNRGDVVRADDLLAWATLSDSLSVEEMMYRPRRH